jgi:predicted membrane protein (TIGR00267 family)
MGLAPPLLDEVVRAITANPDAWVDLMLAQELQLVRVERTGSWRAAAVVGVSALIGSLLPLAPFVAMPVSAANITAVVIASVALFAVGAYKAVITVGHWLRSGLEMTAIGIATAMIGYAVGLLFR